MPDEEVPDAPVVVEEVPEAQDPVFVAIKARKLKALAPENPPAPTTPSVEPVSSTPAPAVQRQQKSYYEMLFGKE